MTHTVVISGVGPGLGESLARRFVAEGCRVALLARTASFIEGLADDLGAGVVAVRTDLTNSNDIEAAFETVRSELGPVDVLVNHASGGSWKGVREVSLDEFEHAWQVGARAGLQCSQEALDDMLGDEEGQGGEGGTILFTGATSSIRGRGGAAAFSSAKFAVRGLAESMAREFGPRGVHVAHVVIDGGILPPGREVENPEEYLDPDAIADSYWHLVQQDESAWTLELDLRPHVEEF
ncbi:short-chain dehydrogenase [Salinigranum rubrum]|uniref:Short-chain dehydrogenase n=1 Tax=Salinigranum rubrum TaxID=755307 RepID=A0A2I8VNK3_9EURY|nr:SDR family NAD(P)-dependent oxidoreductase [Salinigranum rubrum]AUV83517.1 short-chain dehydrogenase [Salinigranum rubrum]